MLDKLERKFGRFAIPHLMNYLIGGYIIGYLLMLGSGLTGVNYLAFMEFDPYQILHAANGIAIPQFWRILTWVLIPPFGSGFLNFIFGVIMMVFYWQLGSILERTWGTFRFNCYIFGGILFTIAGGFILYGIAGAVGGPLIAQEVSRSLSVFVSTNYINMSIFLAFAMGFPDMTVMFWFVIPVKMKWMALIYVLFALYDIVRYSEVGWVYGLTAAVVIFSSLLNFILYFVLSKSYYRVTPRGTARRRRQPFNGFRPDHDAGREKPYHHKCCICGRTDVTNPELTFRYCSKCNGNYEYCQDHLFNHTHVK